MTGDRWTTSSLSIAENRFCAIFGITMSSSAIIDELHHAATYRRLYSELARLYRRFLAGKLNIIAGFPRLLKSAIFPMPFMH